MLLLVVGLAQTANLSSHSLRATQGCLARARAFTLRLICLGDDDDDDEETAAAVALRHRLVKACCFRVQHRKHQASQPASQPVSQLTAQLETLAVSPPMQRY